MNIPEDISAKFFSSDDDLRRIAEHFSCCAINIKPIGNGHINDTYLVETAELIQSPTAHNAESPDLDSKPHNESPIDHNCVHKYILQRINDHVFTSPEELMENMLAVTEHLGGPLRVIPAADGRPLYKEYHGPLQGYWRMLTYIENSYAPESLSDTPVFAAHSQTSFQRADRISTFREVGRAYGEFIYMLSDLPAGSLHTTIEGFHDTRKRFNQLLDACHRDPLGRRKTAEPEIRLALEHEGDVDVLNQAAANGEIPVRIVHNDTKINNILIDRTTGKAACVIDLDTVMPGLSVTDFGDAIRSGASTGREDEPGLELDLDLYHAYAEGFLAGCPDLTTREIEFLPVGAKVMTLECGIRFLTDYLEGDTYFKTDYPEHNLIRCRSQFALLQDIEAKWDQMQ